MSFAEQSLLVGGVRVPRILYGTAWKEDQTQPLTELALRTGFRGIDTANQRRHYFEAAVGQAIGNALGAGLLQRDDLFVQTKFTFIAGQDHRLPYDPAAPIATQVEQSFSRSLEHLGIDRIDSYILHGPSRRVGLAEDDWAAWQAMEKLHDSGRVRLLGVSNVQPAQLESLCRRARIRPHFVQNRCYATAGWDSEIRSFCAVNNILYQGFSLLTANAAAVRHPVLQAIAARHERTSPEIIFRFALDIGMIPLTGTTSADHMRADLSIFDFALARDEIEGIEHIAVR